VKMGSNPREQKVHNFFFFKEGKDITHDSRD